MTDTLSKAADNSAKPADPQSPDALLRVTLNGEITHFAAGSVVADVIARLGLTGKRIAVERNQEIVPKSQHATTLLVAGDMIEIVHAIGGG